MNKKIRIAIVGGGIAGLALMTRLVRYPHLEVNLYEAAEVFSEVGAGISFGINALKAMQLLGLGEAYENIADRMAEPYREVWCQWRNGYSNEQIATAFAAGHGLSSVHRADFLEQLMPFIPVGKVHFNKRLADLTASPKKIDLVFEDLEKVECDYVIGCDGIHSVVRNHVLRSQGIEPIKPRFSGTWAYRGIVKQASFKQALEQHNLESIAAEVPQAFLARNKHIHCFPIRQGQEINVMAFQSKADDGEVAQDYGWITPASKQKMLDDFAEFNPIAQALLNEIDKPTIWALHDIDPLPTYQNNMKNVILIGDAAHATLPHQGSGAGQCLEDALILAHLFAPRQLELHHLKFISQIYEDIRRPRASMAQLKSREACRIYQLQDVNYQDTDALAHNLSTRFEWLWQHDLVEDVIQTEICLYDALNEVEIELAETM